VTDVLAVLSPPDAWVQANQEFLTAAIAVLAGRLASEDVADRVRRRDELLAQMPSPPALHGIAEGFGLSGFERDTLLLCAGVELDTAIASACASANGDPRCRYATFSLAMATLPDPHWSAITPAAALRRWNLVKPAHPETLVTSALRVDERMLHALTGVDYLDQQIRCMADPLEPASTLPPSLQAAANQLALLWSRPASRRVRLHGRRPLDLRAVVSAASVGIGFKPVLLRAGDLPAAAADRDLLARICERESVLAGRCWLLEIDDPVAESGKSARQFARQLNAPVAVACEVPADDDVGVPAIEIPAVERAELREIWRSALEPAGPRLASWVNRLAGQFSLGVADVRSIVAEVQPDDADAGPRLWDACRSRARPALDGLAQRIIPRACWEDLVLPIAQGRLLREMTGHVRHRMTVFEDWGFGARTSRGSGVAALFAGPSGTGKTFAAEVLARHLALDLYRVDLSQVVSKYIGETEKNLRRIFDAAESGGVVLLFDEADALFGKRSEVKDSHDRYANIEVSYLLQRMETYRGLAILTTNLRDAIDTAFLRRLRFVVQFPFPDAVGRAEIWRRVLPPELPNDGLVPEKLARLDVSGGTIRNIALSAAFLAAEAGESVRMPHVLLAARTEYAKLEKPLTDAEVTGWST
jgi:ATPase family protein associated with various cellular activities (AAA)/winged helix domain-containing protein